MGARVVTVNEVLDGHVALDIQCLDRIYLNAYVPKLQSSAQVVAFLSGIGLPVCVSCVVQPDRSAVPEDVPNRVEFRRRPGDHQAALMVSS